MRKANIEDWDIPRDDEGKPKRRTAYVIPPDESDTSDSSSEDSEPLANLARRYRKESKERNNSDNENEIPQLELRKRLDMKQKASQGPDPGSSDSDT